MLFAKMTYIGIDPTAGSRPFAYAVLDYQKHLIALGSGSLDDILAFIAGQKQALAAICAPRQPNLGLMKNEAIRQQLSPVPRPGRWQNYRVAEYILRKHNIHITPTPHEEKSCPKWMRVGFNFYKRLLGLGYCTYPIENEDFQFIEVYPQACYAVLLGQNPFLKHTLEGKMQRQLLLHDQQVKIPDPMHFFEEITRHRLLSGVLPMEILYTAPELDALIAAFCAWKAHNHPGEVRLIGNIEEGQIFLPLKELKNRY